MRIILSVACLCLFLNSALAESPVERGRYIVEVIGACGNCHTPNTPEGKDQSMNLAGGSEIADHGMNAKHDDAEAEERNEKRSAAEEQHTRRRCHLLHCPNPELPIR